MKKMLFTIAALLLAISMYGAGKAEKLELIGNDPDSRKAYFAQPIRIWGSSGFMTDPVARVTLITLSNAKITFVLNLSGKVDAAGKLTANLGMLRPSGANWFANGFFSFDIDGRTPKNTTVTIKEIADASVTLEYTAPAVTATLKITLPDDDDKLLLEFNGQSTLNKGRNYRVEFLTYPSSLGGDYKSGQALRKREGMTAKRTLASTDKYIALQGDEPWILFYDNWFDPQDKRGEGGCALLFNPKQSIRSEVLIGNYACLARFWYRLNTPGHFILWDFKGWSNKSAQEYMRKLNLSF